MNPGPAPLGSGGLPADALLINAPIVGCHAPPCAGESPLDRAIGPFCGREEPRFAFRLSSTTEFYSELGGRPLSLVIPAFERPANEEGEIELPPLPIEASLDPPTAGKVEGNVIRLSSFPVVVTGRLPALYTALPDYLERVSVAEGEFYFGYVFLVDPAGDLIWSEVMHILSEDVCEQP